MTARQEQVLDEALLRVLDENDSRFGLDAASLTLRAANYGVRVDSVEISKRLRYMADPQIGFVDRVEPEGAFHAERDFWRITARGLNHLRRSNDRE